VRRFLELGLLLLQMIGLGCFVVPKHTPTIWADPEFTAWVIPLANRLDQGPALYTDGAHSPLPPLSCVVAYILTGGKGIWWHESFLNYVFQCATLVMLFLLIQELKNTTVAYLSCSAGLIYFISLPKTILYDSFAQALVALCLLALVRVCRHKDALSSVALLGLCVGLLLVSKQSTGVGALSGALFFFLTRRKFQALMTLLLASLTASTLSLLLMSPWVSPGGFVKDVLLLGSKPKGGLEAALSRVGYFGLEFLAYVAIVLVLGMALLSQFKEIQIDQPAPPTPTGPFRWALLLWPLGLALFLGQVFCLWIYPFASVTSMLMWPALVFYLFCTGRFGSLAERAVALVAYTSALGHSLSVHYFRFTYDNNPLLVLVLAFLVSGLVSVPESFKKYRWFGVPFWPTTGVVILLTFAWLNGAQHIYALGQAQVEFPEIGYLRGARLPARVEEGLMRLVRDVRARTKPSDRVLILPEDPNFASWLDRPRPEVTSSVLFMDTYWDSLVEEDLRRLKDQPPEVIIIGRHNLWPVFAQIIKLKPNGHREGVGRLILRLSVFLAFQYEEPENYKITTAQGDDYLSVFYLKSKATKS
jgi:hypothetical protein